MTIAVLSDIHSNFPAFQACCRDALAHGAEKFLFLGDYISDLAQPREVLDLVYSIRDTYPTHCLRGNRERYMLECREGKTEFRPGSKTGSLAFTYEKLREQDFSFLQSLPTDSRVTLGGVTLTLAHAVPGDDRRYFDRDTPEMDAVFSEMNGSWLLTGHSHRQFLRRQGDKAILNPGSVGIPQTGGTSAEYALLEVEKGDVRCILRQVPYDLSSVVRAQFSSGLTEIGGCWAISILYDVLTGTEMTMALLNFVTRRGSVWDEENWRTAAEEMGMAFTEAEILKALTQ